MITIRVHPDDVTAPIPDRFIADDGYIYLDTAPDLDIRSTLRVIELSDIKRVARNTIKKFDLPLTKKNIAILGDIEFLTVALPVHVMNTEAMLPFYHLRVLSCEEAKGSWEVELVGFDWTVRAERKFLNEYDLPLQSYTKQAVEASWNNAPGAPVIYPVAHYNFIYDLDNKTWSWYDARPFVNIGWLLRECFSQLNIEFECPFLLDTTEGRSLYAYLLRPGWGYFPDSPPESLTRLNDPSATYTVQIIPGVGAGLLVEPLPLPASANDDPDNNWDGERYNVLDTHRASIFKIKGAIRIEMENITNLTGRVQLEVIYDTGLPSGDSILFNSGEVEFSEADGTLVITFMLDIEFVNPQTPGAIYFKIGWANDNLFEYDVTVFPDITIERFRYFPTDGEYKLNEVLNPEYSLLQLLEGIMHWMDGKIIESPGKITLLTPAEVRELGIDDSYYKIDEPPQDWSEHVVPGTRVVKRGVEGRIIRYDFDDFDSALEIHPQMEDAYLYDNSRDREIAEIRNDKNPFFSATIDVPFLPEEQNDFENTAVVPALWGDGSPEAGGSTILAEIKPRIVYWYGAGAQDRDFYFDRQTITNWGFASQLPRTDPVGGAFPVTYTTAWELFYSRDLFLRGRGFSFEYLFYLSMFDVYGFDFRVPVRFIYGDREEYFLVYRIKDFSNTRALPTPVELIPIEP